MNTQTTNENPLGSQPVKKLLMQFAIPSIVAMLVSSLYNIVDQFFIGRNVGELGNAATNISFPLSISCIAIALLFGIGGASAFNLAMGKGEKEKAVYYIGNSAVMLFGCGVILTTITLLFLEPLLRFFGSPDNVLLLFVSKCRSNKAFEKRMCFIWSGFEFRMRLSSDEPRMIRNLDHLNDVTVRRETNQFHTIIC